MLDSPRFCACWFSLTLPLAVVTPCCFRHAAAVSCCCALSSRRAAALSCCCCCCCCCRRADFFIKPHVQRGLLPEILSELLEARKQAKKDMKGADPNSLLYNVLNGRQSALKVRGARTRARRHAACGSVGGYADGRANEQTGRCRCLQTRRQTDRRTRKQTAEGTCKMTDSCHHGAVGSAVIPLGGSDAGQAGRRRGLLIARADACARPTDQRQLRVRLHGRASGPAAVPRCAHAPLGLLCMRSLSRPRRDLVQCDGLRSPDD
jgi:hypothetical protein